jgi:hypothetical protein
MTKFIEGCLSTFLAICFILVAIYGILGAFLLVAWLVSTAPVYTLLGLCILCILFGGYVEWQDEREYLKKFYGRKD